VAILRPGRVRRGQGIAAVVLAALFFTSAVVHGQGLAEVWRAALQRDPVYAAARAQRNAEQERIPQARARLLPQVSAQTSALARDARRAGTLGSSAGGQRNLWALTLTQPLYDRQRWGGLSQAQYQASAADLDRQIALQDLMLRVAEAYFAVLAAQDALRVTQAQIEAAQSQLQAAQRSFELGGTTIADTHETQSRLDLLRANAAQARNALRIRRDQLTRIIREPVLDLTPLPAEVALPRPDPDRISAWETQAGLSSLAVARAELVVRIAQTRIDIARDARTPTLQLQAQTGSDSDRRVAGGVHQGARALDSQISLQLSVPLYSGGGISSQVREQTLRLQQARYELEATKRQAVQMTQQYFSSVVSGLAQVEALSAAEASSRASLQANTLGYQVGVRVNIDVLNAQQQLYETQQNLARARYETVLNGLRLKASSGALYEQDILAVDALLKPPLINP